MKTPNTILVAALLSFASSGFAFDLPGLNSASGAASLPPASLPRIDGSEISGSAEAAAEADLEALRAEAAADPDRFIDEHTPEEVGLVFGLSDESRYVIDSSKAKQALVRVKIDLGAQRLSVEAPKFSKVFKISSGLAPKFATPGSGKCFAPDFIQAMHYSTLYNNAPMPNSVFFNGNIALHGTEAEWLLGKPASHGCIRLSKADSKTLYEVVKANGKANTSVCVEGKTPVN